MRKRTPQTLGFRVGVIRRYLIKEVGALTLTTKQAFDHIGTFERGRDLNRALGSERLPTLGISDVARYIVLYT